MKKILFAAIVSFAFSGCLKSDNDNSCSYEECRLVAPASEIQAIQTYLTANSLTATQHCSGLFYSVTQDGSGAKPNFCSTVTINYVGRLTNGTVFDQAPSATNNQPATFNLAGVITGFRNGVPLIKTGGKITLYVPPSLGYGSMQSGPIPANSILIFTVDLLGVQ